MKYKSHKNVQVQYLLHFTTLPDTGINYRFTHTFVQAFIISIYTVIQIYFKSNCFILSQPHFKFIIASQTITANIQPQ